MPATTSRPSLSTNPSPGRPTTVVLLDTAPPPRAPSSGNTRPSEGTAADLLEPHWVAAIEAATD
jgi:hypothetical protein